MIKNWKILSAFTAALALLTLLPAVTLLAAPAARSCPSTSAWISSPAPGDTISGNISIIGSAVLPPGEFRYYKVEFSAAGVNAWVVIVDGVRTPVQNGVLANFNADQLPPGDYSFRVLAVDPTGNYCEGLSSPVHVLPGAPPTATPTPSANDKRTPPATLAPVNPTPTLVIDVATSLPGSDPLMVKSGDGKSLIPALPAEFSSLGASAGEWFGGLGRSFILGVQMTAGLFALLGAIVFLRRNL